MKRNLLVISPWIPYPLSSGGNQACYNALKAIYDDFNIKLVFHSFSKKDDSKVVQFNKLLPSIKVYRYNVKKGINYYLAKVRQKFFVDRNSLDMRFDPLIYDIQDYVRFVENVILKEEIEIVQCEFLPTLEYIHWLNDKLIRVYVHHEIRFVRNQQLLKDRKGVKYRKLCSELKAKEISALKKYDAIITLSDADSTLLKKEGVMNTYPSFSIIDNHYFRLQQDSRDVCFVILGSDQHAPNLIGLHWFLKNVLPLCGSIHIKVIGRWSSSNIKSITSEYPSVSFVGFVENLADAFRNAVLLVPLTIGSGIRMKIVEAASMGIPVISTTIGASGLPFENEKELIIADTPQDFKIAINRVMDLNFRERLSKAIYEKQRVVLSLKALKENRLNIYDNILAK